MKKIREILRLRFGLKQSHRDIGASCGLSPSTVGECLARCKRENLGWPLSEELSDSELEARVYRVEPCKEEARPIPDWDYVHAELRRRDAHVSKFCVWDEYRKAHPDGYEYSWFCQQYAAWTSTIEPVMRQQHRAGRATFVDYAGDTLKVVDLEADEVKTAQVFLGVLGASNYTYAEATWTQQLSCWVGSHVRMFTFFGGTTELLIPDNLLSGVKKADFYDPDINPTYAKLAEHYGVAVLPARKRKPKDKAKVESAVLHAERTILAKLRNRVFYSLDEVNEAIAELLEELNQRPFQKLPGCRRTAFEQLDSPALRPLPARPFEVCEWKWATVHIDYHVQVTGCFYSVPHRLVRERVEVRLTESVVEIIHDNHRVACHRRSWEPGYVTTLAEHMPSNHKEVASWSPDVMRQRALRVGPWTSTFVGRILDSKEHPEVAVRSCLGVLGLARKHSNTRLELACQRAVEVGALHYGFLKQFLKSELDRGQKPAESPPVEHENLRGAEHYEKVAQAC